MENINNKPDLATYYMYEQNDEIFKFELPDNSDSIIKVMGVGGGGSNAVNYMYKQGIKGVDFFVCNTDVQALNKSPVPNKIQIGKSSAKGLGAGTDPEAGRLAAEENADEIKELLKNGGAKMVFITAGMGGGTGTGAAPVIARIAHELNILTVGIVTLPFTYEGPNKNRIAQDGISKMKSYCDTVLVVVNDNIIKEYGNQPLREAYFQADAILATAAKAIAETITNPSDWVNVDFNDVRNTLLNGKNSVMGSGTAAGENRINEAISRAMDSKLLDNNDIKGATKILVSVMHSNAHQITADEFHQLLGIIQNKAGSLADLKYGITTDDTLGESIQVTIIAAGFGVAQEPYVEVPQVTMPTANFDIPIAANLVDGTAALNPEPVKEPEPEIQAPQAAKEEVEELPFPVENTLISKPQAPIQEPKEVVSLDGNYLMATDLNTADNPLSHLEQKGIARTLTLDQIELEMKKRGNDFKNTGRLPKVSSLPNQSSSSYSVTETNLQNFPPAGPSLSSSVITGNKYELGKNRFLHDQAD